MHVSIQTGPQCPTWFQPLEVRLELNRSLQVVTSPQNATLGAEVGYLHFEHDVS